MIAVSFLTASGPSEHHAIVTPCETRFRLRDPDRDVETMLDADDVATRVLDPLEVGDDVLLAVVDHVDASISIGFVARRLEGDWSDLTDPNAPRIILWQDVVAEVWAALQRLAFAPRTPAPSDTEAVG